jgi:hypothetical protein
MYFLSFLIVGVTVVVDVERIFRSEITPPINGSTPYGSGALKSLNHRKPSVRMLGFKS